MTDKTTETNNTGHIGKFTRTESKVFAEHAEAVAQVAAWRKQFKLPKDESHEPSHRVRIRMRSSGSKKSQVRTFEATLAAKRA